MAAQSAGEARSRGALPPALRTLPAPSSARARGDATPRSIWAICAAFSRSVMRASRSRTRASTGADASLYSGAAMAREVRRRREGAGCAAERSRRGLVGVVDGERIGLDAHDDATSREQRPTGSSAIMRLETHPAPSCTHASPVDLRSDGGGSDLAAMISPNRQDINAQTIHLRLGVVKAQNFELENLRAGS